MISTHSEYVFALCNPGSESALKSEVASQVPGWRLSYQRRGFVTFRAESPQSLADLDWPLACARRLALSLGRFSTRVEAVARLAQLSQPRDQPILHDAKYQDRKMQGIIGGGRPEIGQSVATVVELAPDEFWLGLHRHARFLSPDPAGDGGLVMPLDSPSRAWLKLEEAVRHLTLTLTPSDIVVELGCAPGGVVLALLQRGISVVGVDPAKMAGVVLQSAIASRSDASSAQPWFFHCRKPAALASKRDLGPGVTWFMSDMNQSPDVVLKECARFCAMAPSIRGILITLKLTDLSQIADKPQWFAALAALGFKTIRLQQLSVHHREFVLLAM